MHIAEWIEEDGFNNRDGIENCEYYGIENCECFVYR